MTREQMYFVDLSMQIERIKYEMNKMDKYNLDNDDIVKSCVEELIKIYDLDKDLSPIRSKYDDKQIIN